MGGATGRTGDTSMASRLTAVLWTVADPSTGADPYDSHDKALSSPWDEGNTLNRAGAEDTTARSASGGGRFFGCCPPPQPQRRRLPITQAAQGQPLPSGGPPWQGLRPAGSVGRAGRPQAWTPAGAGWQEVGGRGRVGLRENWLPQ
jgi:hypothetical protein